MQTYKMGLFRYHKEHKVLGVFKSKLKNEHFTSSFYVLNEKTGAKKLFHYLRMSVINKKIVGYFYKEIASDLKVFVFID